MSRNIVEEIKNRLNINTVMGFYLDGRKDYKGTHKYTCPFHGDGNEKTPSLYASDDRGNYKCFGCQEYGDLVSFVMKYDKNNNLSFYEALEQLKDDFAEELNDIDISYSNTRDKDYGYKKLIYEFHDEINEIMVNELNKKEGESFLKYLLQDRKLDKELIDKFKIGYSNGRKIEDKIKELQNTEKYEQIKLKDTGFFTTNTNNDSGLYFLFSDRIMYPIFNNRKKIIGWSGGKTYDEQEPKYINSVNNFIYNKSANLFNYDKINFSNNNTIYICEGNLDSTQLYNYGADNALSLLGTNLTDTQINLFKNKIQNVVLLLDNDEAGGNAVTKISKLLLSHGIIPYIVNINPYKDIDDFLKGHPELKGKIKEYIDKNKKDVLSDYLIKSYVLNIDKMTIDQRYKILTIVKDIYGKISDDIIKNIYKHELGKHNIEFENLEQEYINEQKNSIENENKADHLITKKILDDKWDYDKYIKYALYLILNNYIDESDIEARNFELNILLNSNELFNKYKQNKEMFYKDNSVDILEFDIIKMGKEQELFNL